MLANTFIHLAGIGPVRERALWDAGIHTWRDFLSADGALPAVARSARSRTTIAECVRRLDEMDSAYFARAVPRSESWRMYAEFRHNAAFLDIETTGLSRQRDIITLVGILDRDGYHSFVYDRNLSDLREAIERYDLIVTFNGASFDLPFIEHHFGSIFRHVPHIDLKPPLRRIGMTGGLKAIEQRLGVGRPSDLSGLSGFDAVRMWHMWERGDRAALDTLIRYNAEDVLSLPKLAEKVYNELSARLSAPAPPLAAWDYAETDLPFDMTVIAKLNRRW